VEERKSPDGERRFWMITSGRPSGGTVLGDARYTFRLAERMSPTALAVFPELATEAEPTTGTLLHGRLRDSSELLSVLERLDLLGVTILEFHRLPD
jgi:hypothetical protein